MYFINTVHFWKFTALFVAMLFVDITKGQVICQQMGPCKCNLTDGSGVIDLTRVALNDNTPKWFDTRGADGYKYSYNPCVSFTEGPYCGDVAACKTANDSKTRWPIADPTTPTFHYDGNHAHILYTYNASGNYSLLDVVYVCNFSSYDDTFIPLGETKPGSGIYNATVMTRCACPNVCVFPPKCSFVSPCACNLTDWSGMIDISQYSKRDGLPAFSDVNGTDGYLYSYNPCYGFTQGACKNVTGCRTSPDMKIQEPLGDPSTAQFSYREDDNVHIVYSMPSNSDNQRMFDVALYCDYDADPPKFEAYNETKNGSNVFTAKLSTRCACAGECSGISRPRCIKIDDCSCNMTDGSGVIDLSLISKQDGTSTFTDELAPDGYYYSYNPCHGFTEGSCKNATGCLVDDKGSVQYTIGDPGSSRFDFDDVRIHVMYNHTDADGIQRFLDVGLVCDRDAEKSIFVPSGKPSQQSNYVTGQLLSKCACPNGCMTREKPSCQMINSCSCNMTDGSGVVDVTSLSKTDGIPAFPDISAPDGYFYSYNLCNGFNEGDCQNVTVCKITRNEAAEYPVGLPGKFQFLFDGSNVHMVHNFATPSKFVYRFDVTLICDKTAGSPSIKVAGETYPGSGNYTASVTSKCACPGGC